MSCIISSCTKVAELTSRPKQLRMCRQHLLTKWSCEQFPLTKQVSELRVFKEVLGLSPLKKQAILVTIYCICKIQPSICFTQYYFGANGEICQHPLVSATNTTMLKRKKSSEFEQVSKVTQSHYKAVTGSKINCKYNRRWEPDWDNLVEYCVVSVIYIKNNT